jgi:chemosensory pili system protein ChpA (sensor histidine kinase/response regulator)
MANPDATLLSWIAAEVDQALSVVREHIARFKMQRADPALLRACPEHLHQVSGALRMVGLAGATRFCEALEKGFAGHAGAAPRDEALAVLDRSVATLKEFVEALTRGQPDLPLRLYPVYRQLTSLLGGSEGREKDLFFPDLSRPPPPHPEARSLPAEELTALVRAQRVHFQRGLLAWLRGKPGGLGDMAEAVDALNRVAAQLPEPRGLWWVAAALLDAMKTEQENQWLSSVRALCNRIDFQMRDLAAEAGAGEAREALLREALYAIAKCPRPTPRTAEVRRFYELDSFFPPPDAPATELELNSEWLEAALYDLHSRLEALKSAWVHYVAGEQKTSARVRELVLSFKAKAQELGNRHLIKMLDAISLVVKRLPDPYPRQQQYMVIEMASAFLMIESIVDHFTSPAEDLEQQIVLLGGWLLDSAEGRSSEPPAGLRGDLVQQIGALQLRAQVAREISANLQHMEQVLDTVGRDPAKRDSALALKPMLRQVQGALEVIGMARAAQVVTHCEAMLEAFGTLEPERAAEELDWIAEGLSSIGFYLDPCLGGREPAEAAIELFFQRFARRNRREQAGRAPAEAAPEGQPAAPAARPGVDAELLGVFLDEAGEVLERIDEALVACREPTAQDETLLVIRRGFHTLKGSGRMVGLMDLGEVAWEIEQLLNHWLEHKHAATPDLLELLAQAARAFAGWVRALRAGSLTGEVDGAALVEGARRLRASAAAAPEEVTIGETTLARAFLEIYVKEAAGHVATLEAEFAAWRARPGSAASQAFMRAAHTLASSSGTAGFVELAALAGAIEQWIPFAAHTSDPADAEVLAAAIARLRAMADAIARRESAGAAADHRRRLQALTARLESAPPRPVEGAAPREKRAMRDDLDSQLLSVFREEAQELLPSIGADLREWSVNPSSAIAALQSLQRALHTLKGSARMAGAMRLGELTHIMESRIEAALEEGMFPPELFADLEEKLDRLSGEVERMAPAPQPAPGAQSQDPLRAPVALLRISADMLDHLINEAGEVSIGRSRVEAELRAVRASLAELGESVARLRAQLREVEVQADSQMQSRLSVLEERASEYDPLEFDRYTRLQELTRLMAESLHDIVTIQQGLARNLGETDAALAHQARAGRGVQQELMRMRAVPFATLGERLHRVVRQTARELGRQAELAIEGAQLELDRSVLERIAAPLEHMLRNAVAHGLETAEARAAAGKPLAGRIVLTLRQEANEMALVLADDGAGIDTERLLAKAVEKGLVAPDARPGEHERLQLVFSAGLSTAEDVSELAGRGVGMDVVRSEITAIGGRVDIASARGKGTAFTVYLPLTLAVTQAVLVRAAGNLLAVSTVMVEQVLRLKSEAMTSLYAAKQIEFHGHVYPLQSLRHLLDPAAPTEVAGYNSVLLLRSGVQRVALHVDELAGNQEIVVKPIGPQLARVAWITGATVLGDGAIVPIINPVVLASRSRDPSNVFSATTPVPQLAPAVGAGAPLVMVVDDSLTVRKVTTRLLEREGYQVRTAKDGLDALEQLRNALPALMLIDIEMPRMDGFDLARSLRADERTRDIPIIIISSRTAEKHRSQAAALGVHTFLGKPYDEAELLRQVATLAGVVEAN